MKRRLLLMAVALVAAGVFVMCQVLFVVRSGEAVVLTTFGKPEPRVYEAGLHTRWPWPVQKLYTLDTRLQTLEGTFSETYTQDRKNVILLLYACWKIDDPLRFVQRVGTVEQAESGLEGLIGHYKNGVLGAHQFSDLVSTNEKALKLEAIETEILDSVRPEARDRYGILLTSLGIRKINLPESITAKVFERMRAERQGAADALRSEGEAEAVRIRAQAEKQKDQLLAAAEADAKRLRAEGDAEAAQYYRVFEKNPELAMYLRKLDALEESLKNKSTLILGTDTMPYDLLGGDSGLPSEAREAEGGAGR